MAFGIPKVLCRSHLGASFSDIWAPHDATYLLKGPGPPPGHQKGSPEVTKVEPEDPPGIPKPHLLMLEAF